MERCPVKAELKYRFKWSGNEKVYCNFCRANAGFGRRFIEPNKKELTPGFNSYQLNLPTRCKLRQLTSEDLAAMVQGEGVIT